MAQLLQQAPVPFNMPPAARRESRLDAAEFFAEQGPGELIWVLSCKGCIASMKTRHEPLICTLFVGMLSNSSKSVGRIRYLAAEPNATIAKLTHLIVVLQHKQLLGMAPSTRLPTTSEFLMAAGRMTSFAGCHPLLANEPFERSTTHCRTGDMPIGLARPAAGARAPMTGADFAVECFGERPPSVLSI